MGPKKDLLILQNHWIERQSLTVTLFRFPSTAIVTDRACNISQTPLSHLHVVAALQFCVLAADGVRRDEHVQQLDPRRRREQV